MSGEPWLFHLMLSDSSGIDCQLLLYGHLNKGAIRFV